MAGGSTNRVNDMSKGGWTVVEKTDPIAAKIAELDALIEQQKARLAAMPTGGGGLSGNDLKAILAGQTEATKALVESARPARHSNPDHEHKSAFSYPEGDLKRPKPTFLIGANGKPREVYFNHHLERPDDLTPAEIEAYNLITKDCSARDGRWTAEVKANALYVKIPSFTNDDRQDMHNGLVLNLRELASGPKAVNLVDVVAELNALRAQVAQGGLVVAQT
jgi:hypothetical protein